MSDQLFAGRQLGNKSLLLCLKNVWTSVTEPNLNVSSTTKHKKENDYRRVTQDTETVS